MATVDQQNKMTEMADKASLGDIMQYRGHINILKNGWVNEGFRINPPATTVLLSSKTAQADLGVAKKSVKGINYIAQKAEKQGKAEAQSLLDKFKSISYVEDISAAIDNGNPIKSFDTFDKFEKSKPASVLEAERIAQSEAEQERINAMIGTE
jgi:hypothetical protein